MTRESKSVAIVGGGWAGCAAAVELARSGHRVHLFEAARVLGGRARSLRQAGTVNTDNVWEAQLDNGQHILLGAYKETLRLMRVAGVDVGKTLLRLPLQMRYPFGSGGMDFLAARLPAPLHLLAALWRATGLDREDKMSLARFTTTARWIDWRLNQDCSVKELLERFDQTERVTQLLWRPLCLAALNTPPARASAQVFLNVLRDSLGARRGASDMLIPRVDLSALFPAAAARFVERHGGVVKSGVRVTSLQSIGRRWRLEHSSSAPAEPDFDAVILATPATEAARLLAGCGTHAAAMPGPGALAGPASASVVSISSSASIAIHAADVAGVSGAPGVARPALLQFAHEPITTCYLQYPPTVRLPLPMHALLDDADHQRWGQFVFDRGQLDSAQAGLLAVVISAASEAVLMSPTALGNAIAAQLAADFNDPALLAPQRVRVISEKRATFSCTPGLQRPTATTAHPGLYLAGDYVAGDYPATIEGAVQSGVRAARLSASS